jgi:hypothetical protein
MRGPRVPAEGNAMSATERYRIEADGTVVTVYTDTVDLRALGHVRARRVSVVEWDESAQAWIARILASGEVLGPFATRAKAVSAERAVLATRLAVAAKRHPSDPPLPVSGAAHLA